MKVAESRLRSEGRAATRSKPSHTQSRDPEPMVLSSSASGDEVLDF